MLYEAPVLAFYDPSLPTVVSADSSSYRLGACTMQEQDGGLRPVAFASKSLSTAERRSVFVCERFSMYLWGLRSYRLLTDHRPLLPLINTRDLDQVPLRCQRLLMRRSRFNPEAQHVPGKAMVVSDALVRCQAEMRRSASYRKKLRATSTP